MGHRNSALALRVATFADARALGVLHRRSAIAGYGHVFPPSSPPPSEADFVQEWNSWLSEDSSWRADVAADRDRVMGAVMYGPKPADDSTGRLARLYVDPGHWGGGIGRVLHDHAVEQLARAGYDTATLWVLDGNDRARSWYERLGWVPTGRTQFVVESAGITESQLRRTLAKR